MTKTQITQVQVLDALWALDERHGGFKTHEAATTIIAHLAGRLPSLELEESGDLCRIYEPLTEQYFWPERSGISSLNEAVDKIVADIITATGRQPTDLPTFEFTITRDVTQSAQVKVQAATIEQAQRMALQREFYSDPGKAKFTVDDGQENNAPYLPDGDDYAVARRDGRDAIDSTAGKDVPVPGMKEPDQDPSP